MPRRNRPTESVDRIVLPVVKEMTGLVFSDGFLRVQWITADDGKTHELPVPAGEVSKALVWLQAIWDEHGGKDGPLARRAAQASSQPQSKP